MNDFYLWIPPQARMEWLAGQQKDFLCFGVHTLCYDADYLLTLGVQ